MTRRSNTTHFLIAAVAAAGLGALALPANAQLNINIGIGHAPPPPPAPPVVVYPQAPAPVLLDPQQIDQLTGPIALYPDPLLAQLLPAATYPDDISAAAGWLQRYPQASDADIDAQPWDPSVKAIVHYPTVLQQMAGNLEWTQALGAAFVNQQQDVMASIQRLRAQAASVGSLVTTPEQQVVYDNSYIQILPVQPDFLYVPVYDPLVIYTRRIPLAFHDHYRIGRWDDYGFDWDHHWVSGGYDWSSWRPGRAVTHRPDVTVHPWVHDNRRPAPVMPQKYVRPADNRDYRGYQPAPNVSNHAFDTNQNRADVERAEQRARESRPQEVHAPAPAPAPRVEQHVEQPRVEPRVEPRAPAPAPEPVHAAPAPAPRPANPLSTNAPSWGRGGGTFAPAGSAAEINAQSQRGNQSMHH